MNPTTCRDGPPPFRLQAARVWAPRDRLRRGGGRRPCFPGPAAAPGPRFPNYGQRDPDWISGLGAPPRLGTDCVT